MSDNYGSKTITDALDEIYELRLLLASEARILEAHLDYKTFPKSRRRVAEESITRMRHAIKGTVKQLRPDAAKLEYREVYGSQTLTMSQWQKEAAS